MDMFGYRQNAMGACDGTGMVDSVVCPKPRRFGFLRCSVNHGAETEEAAGAQLLDSIFPEGGYDPEGPCSPFFLGSPPSRASNPLVQDARFTDERLIQPSYPAPPSPSARNGGGCSRTKFGHKPATVRVEGFSCSISAMA